MAIPWEGDSSNPDTPGIKGKSTATTAGIGVAGKSVGVSGVSVQGPGVAGDSQEFVGVLGTSHSANAAVAGINDNAGPGVLGRSLGGAAGVFDGNVTVSGDITVREVQISEAQPGAPGLAKQVADLSSALQALTERMRNLDLQLVPIGSVVAFAGDVHSLANWKLFATATPFPR